MNNKHDSLDAREKEVTESRREFLKKAGRFAVYTPPAVMLLMKPSHATMMDSVRPQPPQVTGTLKEYFNRTGPFDYGSYQAQQGLAPASAKVSYIDHMRNFWTGFWRRVFGS